MGMRRRARGVPMPKPYSLDAKANEKLAKMVLVNSRLSVQPVAVDEWNEICRLGGLDPKEDAKR